MRSEEWYACLIAIGLENRMQKLTGAVSNGTGFFLPLCREAVAYGKRWIILLCKLLYICYNLYDKNESNLEG